jgi:hypothetical protein
MGPASSLSPPRRTKRKRRRNDGPYGAVRPARAAPHQSGGASAAYSTTHLRPTGQVTGRNTGRPNAADDTDEPAGHERESQERHARLNSSTDKSGSVYYTVSQDGQASRCRSQRRDAAVGAYQRAHRRGPGLRRGLGRPTRSTSTGLEPVSVAAGIDRNFVYGTAQGDNAFTVKAMDRAGNTSAASNAATAVLWPC